MSQALVSALNERIGEALDPLIPAGAPVALVGFPNHPNVGDSAIWLGERAWLKRRRADVRYACDDVSSYSGRDLARCLGPDGIVLLHGGGNFGDVWPEHQAFRERVISDHRARPIVQLPQSLQFSEGANLRAARRAVRPARNLVVLCRDRPSLETAAELGAEARLCPDLAFSLGHLDERSRPTRDLVWLGRTDTERRRAAEAEVDVETVDWLDEAGSPRAVVTYDRLRSLSLRYGRFRARRPRASALDRRLLPLAYDGLARRRLRYGLGLLSQGRIVVTDRLHGHILSLLLGKRHVLFDSGYGKLTRFHELWSGPAVDAGLLRVVGESHAALDEARAWLAEGR
jgi:exopolysaccharide biosynthesis predicted pyruvyltransferase EpsI